DGDVVVRGPVAPQGFRGALQQLAGDELVEAGRDDGDPQTFSAQMAFHDAGHVPTPFGRWAVPPPPRRRAPGGGAGPPLPSRSASGQASAAWCASTAG